jgi:HEPN domain-containing protein
MAEVENRFPNWFRTEMEFLRESSKILVKKRELSLYGGEEAFLTPDEVINRKDARDATTRAEKTYGLCEKLITEINKQ